MLNRKKVAVVISIIFVLWLIISINDQLKERTNENQELKEKTKSLQELNKVQEDRQKQLENEKQKLEKDLQAKAEAKKLAETQQVRVASATSQPVKAGVEQWRPLVAKYFPANQVENALLTMSRESGGNPRAVSKTDDHGLFQINHGLANHGEQIYDPEYNVRLAYNGFFKTRGWTPWYAVRGILW